MARQATELEEIRYKDHRGVWVIVTPVKGSMPTRFTKEDDPDQSDPDA